jgi:hypothetical protein
VVDPGTILSRYVVLGKAFAIPFTHPGIVITLNRRDLVRTHPAQNFLRIRTVVNQIAYGVNPIAVFFLRPNGLQCMKVKGCPTGNES